MSYLTCLCLHVRFGQNNAVFRMRVSHLIAGAINTVQQSTNKSSTSTATVPDIDGSHEDSLGVLV